MNKFITLFVLSLLMLEMQNNAMEKQPTDSLLQSYVTFLHNNNEKDIKEAKSEVEKWTKFFEQENSNSYNVINYLNNNSKVLRDQEQLNEQNPLWWEFKTEYQEKRNNTFPLTPKKKFKLPIDAIHVVRFNITLKDWLENHNTTFFLALSKINRYFNIKKQTEKKEESGNRKITMFFKYRQYSIEQVKSMYSCLGTVNSAIGLDYGKNRVDKYDDEKDKKTLVKNWLLQHKKDEFYPKFCKQLSLAKDNKKSKRQFDEFHGKAIKKIKPE